MKKFAAMILTTGMLAVFGAGALAAGNVTLEQAKQAALSQAGMKASDVRFTKAHADREDCRMVYEIEFWKGNTEYDFSVDAATGRIREADVDRNTYAEYNYDYDYDDHDYYDYYDDHDYDDYDDHDGFFDDLYDHDDFDDYDDDIDDFFDDLFD